MKRLVCMMTVLVMAGSAPAGLIATPHVAGAFDGWAGPASYPMVETEAGSDIWTVSLSGLTPDGRYEFKVTDGTWGLISRSPTMATPTRMGCPRPRTGSG